MNAERKAWIREALSRCQWNGADATERKMVLQYLVWASTFPDEIAHPWDGSYRVPEQFRQQLIDLPLDRIR